MSRLSFDALIKALSIAGTITATMLAVFTVTSLSTATSSHACQFLVPDNRGGAQQGPSFEAMPGGFTRGVLSCGEENHNLMVMTLNIDPKQDHIGVRDDPLFTTDVTGALQSVEDVPVSDHTKVHVLSRVNQSPLIGVRRGFVRFATLCRTGDISAPLNCSWGSSRIKFRTTVIDTDQDQEVDSSYHELSVYQGKGRLHMITFWTPHRDRIDTTAHDWISALKAFGLDVTEAG